MAPGYVYRTGLAHGEGGTAALTRAPCHHDLFAERPASIVRADNAQLRAGESILTVVSFSIMPHCDKHNVFGVGLVACVPEPRPILRTAVEPGDEHPSVRTHGEVVEVVARRNVRLLVHGHGRLERSAPVSRARQADVARRKAPAFHGLLGDPGHVDGTVRSNRHLRRRLSMCGCVAGTVVHPHWL